MEICPKCKYNLKLVYDTIYECEQCGFMIRKSKFDEQYKVQKEEWYKEISFNEDLWYRKNIQEYPLIVAYEYEALFNLISKGNIYGAFLKLKDLLEVLIKFPTLISINHIFNKKNKTENDYILLQLVLGKSLSLGDWREIANNIYNNKLYDDININYILKDIKKIFFNENIDIVKWRNESLGHGALKKESDEKFKKEISDRLKVICNHFKKCDENYKRISVILKNKSKESILKGTEIDFNNLPDGELYFKSNEKSEELYPFIVFLDKSIYFFDGYLDKKNKATFLNYNNGHKKEIVKNEITKMYHNSYEKASLLIQKAGIVNKLLEQKEKEYKNILPEFEKILNEFETIVDYTDTIYLDEWLKDRIKNQNKALLLLKMQRGMGKTTFVKNIEQKNLAWITEDNIVIKVCLINNILKFDEDYLINIISDLLRTDSDGKVIISDIELKSLLNGINNPKERFLKVLSYYYSIYSEHYNKNKIVLIIDGVDELNHDNAESLFNIMPNNTNIPESIFILLTSRTDKEIYSGIVQEIENIEVRDENKLIVDKQSSRNIEVLKKYIEDKFDIHKNDLIDKILQKCDYRFLYLSIIKNLYDLQYDIFADFNTRNVLSELLSQIKLIFGEKYFEEIRTVLYIITLGNMPLTLEEIYYFYGDKNNISNLLAYIFEIRTILSIDRSNRGNLISISNKELKELIINEYKDDLEKVLQNWLEKLEEVLKEEEFEYSDGKSYLISNILSYEDSNFSFDYNTLFNINSVKDIHIYLENLIKYTFKTYVSDRYHSINNTLLKIEKLLLEKEKGTNKALIELVNADTLSKAGDYLFIDNNIDCYTAVNNYKIAINKRIDFLKKLEIDFDLLIDGKYEKDKLLKEDIFIINKIAEDYINICRAYYRFGIIDKCEKYCLDGIGLYKNYADLNENHNKLILATHLLELSRVYEKKHKCDESINIGNEAKQILLDLLTEKYDVVNTRCALTRINECLGTTYLKINNSKMAIKLYKEGIDLINETLSENSIEVIAELRYAGLLYEKIGSIYLEEKNMRKAKYYFEKEIDIYNELDSKGIMYEKSQYIEVHKDMGIILLDTGFYEDAINEYNLALNALNKNNSLYAKKDNINLIIKLEIYLGIADSMFLLKDYKNSIKYYEWWLTSMLDNIPCISERDLKLTFERLQVSYKKINDNLKYTKIGKQLKRLSKLEECKEATLNKYQYRYVLLGSKNVNSEELESGIKNDKEVDNNKYYYLDLKNNKISKCIKDVAPVQCRYSQSKKYFQIKFDKHICKQCEIIGCNQKESDKILKISLKKLKEISIIE